MSAASHQVPLHPPELAPVPAHEGPPKRRRWPWLLLIVVLMVGGIGIWRMSTSPAPAQPAAAAPTVRTAVAAVGSIQQTIRVGGQTSAIDFSNVTAPIMRGREQGSEMVLLYLADAGSWVKKGSLVAQIDAQSMQDHIDDLADTIRAAESDVAKRKAEQSIEWENLQQSLRVAKASMEKAELDNNASEVLTDIQQQLAKLSLEESRAAYEQLQADLAEKRKAHAAELRILELTLLRHTQHRDRHKRDIQAFSINAAMDGLVVMEQTFRGSEFGQIQQGDQIRPGQKFMKIVNTNSMQVEGTINQAESGNFRVGQPARVKLDAFPGLEFKGKVHSIGALAVSQMRSAGQYVRTVPIKVAIEGSHPKLIPDLSASADVIIDSAEDQVLVPLSAVKNEDGKPVVYVKAGETLQRRPVELGLQSELKVAITSGLKAGEVVRVN